MLEELCGTDCLTETLVTRLTETLVTQCTPVTAQCGLRLRLHPGVSFLVTMRISHY